MWDVLSTGGSSRLERILESERLNITDYVDNRKWGVEGLVKALKKVTLISRYQIGGSIGKGTSLGADHMPDIDVNLFINGLPENSSSQDIEAFLKNQVNVIATHFRTRCWRFCKVLYPTRTTASKSVGLYLYREASKVDLIPGIDFALPDQQYNVVMNRIANAGTNLPWTSLCYAEESVRFMNDKSEFSLNVVRAAKYWNKLCVSMAPLSGRSTIVEIVALRAAQDEVDHHGPTRLLGALVRFFKYMTQPWYNIRIVVRYDRTKYWPTKVHSKVSKTTQ